MTKDSNDSDPVLIDENGYNAVHKAIQNDDLKTVKTFIEKQKDLAHIPNEKNKLTPLHLWATGTNGYHLRVNHDNATEILNILIANGAIADIEARTLHGYTPLMVAAESGTVKHVEKLLEAGADIHAKDEEGKSVFELAKSNDNKEIVEFIKKKILDPVYESLLAATSEKEFIDIIDNNDKIDCISMYAPNSPISLAIDREYTGALDILFAKNASSNQHLEDKRAFFRYAIESEKIQALKALLMFPNSDVLLDQDSEGKTLLHHTIINQKDTETTKALLDGGAEKDAKDKQGKTPLHYAVEQGNEKIVKELLEVGANKDAADRQRKSPLHYAVDQKNIEACKILLEADADKNFKDDLGKTPLHYAVDQKNIDAFKILLEAGADQNVTDKQGKTPLYYAAKQSNKGMIKILSENPEGYSPLRWAITNSKVDIGQLICKTIRKENDQKLDKLTNKKKQEICENLSNAADQEEFIEIIKEHSYIASYIDETGHSPLLIAIEKGYGKNYGKAIELLLENGASVIDERYKDKYLDRSPLLSRNISVDAASILLQYSQTNLDTEYSVHKNPQKIHENHMKKVLHYTVESNNTKLLDFFYKQNMNLPTDHLLNHAVKHANEETVEFLLKRCDNKNLNDLLYSAFKNDGIKNMRLLFEHGADPNTTYLEGHKYMNSVPILHLAIEKNDIEIVKILLEHGANPHDKIAMHRFAIIGSGSYHIDAFQLAAEKGNQEMTKLLKNNHYFEADKITRKLFNDMSEVVKNHLINVVNNKQTACESLDAYPAVQKYKDNLSQDNQKKFNNILEKGQEEASNLSRTKNQKVGDTVGFINKVTLFFKKLFMKIATTLGPSYQDKAETIANDCTKDIVKKLMGKDQTNNLEQKKEGRNEVAGKSHTPDVSPVRGNPSTTVNGL